MADEKNRHRRPPKPCTGRPERKADCGSVRRPGTLRSLLQLSQPRRWRWPVLQPFQNRYQCRRGTPQKQDARSLPPEWATCRNAATVLRDCNGLHRQPRRGSWLHADKARGLHRAAEARWSAQQDRAGPCPRSELPSANQTAPHCMSSFARPGGSSEYRTAAEAQSVSGCRTLTDAATRSKDAEPARTLPAYWAQIFAQTTVGFTAVFCCDAALGYPRTRIDARSPRTASTGRF